MVIVSLVKTTGGRSFIDKIEGANVVCICTREGMVFVTSSVIGV